MNKKTLHILAAALATCTAVGAADLSGITNLLPHGLAVKLALWPAVAAAVAHILLAMGDVLDDGEMNGSFPKSVLRGAPLALLIACLILLPSCTGVAVNASTPWGEVQTVDGQTVVQLKPILIDPAK